MTTHEHDKLEQATSARLSKLSARPVDMTRLQREMDRVTTESGHTAAPAQALRHWWRPITTIAAALLLAAGIGWLLLDGGATPVMAAPTELAQIHYDVTHELSPHLKVSSVEEANRLLADQAAGVVAMPQLPGEMKSCCLHQHAGVTLSCALIEDEGQLITVALADGAKMHCPDGATLERDGRRFIAHTANGINMVMANENGKWLCVMGDVPTDKLLNVAAGIRM